MSNQEDILEEVKKRRKKKGIRWLEKEAEKHILPVKWKPKKKQ